MFCSTPAPSRRASERALALSALESWVFAEAPQTSRSKLLAKLTIAFSVYQRNLSSGIYPRDLTEFEARFADESACRDLLVSPALAGGLSVAPSSEE